MSWLKLYFKLAWFLKTPLILLLDTRYKPIGYGLIRTLCKAIGLTWDKDFSDCDDFAWLFKAKAIRRGLNGVGLVVGRMGGKPHCWNVALVEYSLYQVEPQTGMTFKKLSNYRAWFVII